MLPFPQLEEADFEQLRGLLEGLLATTGATAALLVEQAGYLILSVGALEQCEPAQLATLAANAYNATEYIANLIGDDHFNCMFQQGDKLNVLWRQVDKSCIVVIVFPAAVGVGFVRFHAHATAAQLEQRLATARARSPRAGLDLSELNPREVAEVFRRKPR